MKAFLIVLVFAAAGAGAYYFYFRDHPISLVQGPEAVSSPAAGSGAAPAAKKDFKEFNARLQSAMDHIPTNLRDARQLPAYALDTKARLAPYLQLHTEYTTIDQACDLIINADQTFVDHQQRCGLAPADPGASAQERARSASTPNPPAYHQQQPLWDGQRRQSHSKGRQLLATLENKRL